MAYLALLGDSVFDNGSYTKGGPAVVSQLKRRMPLGWRVTLAAVDGARIDSVAEQVARLPSDVERLALSIGGNDVLGHVSLLEEPVTKSAQAVGMIGDAARGRQAIIEGRRHRLRLAGRWLKRRFAVRSRRGRGHGVKNIRPFAREKLRKGNGAWLG